MKILHHFKSRLELKLILSTFTISTLIVLLFSFIQFRQLNSSLTKVYDQEHIATSNALAIYAATLFEKHSNSGSDFDKPLKEITNELQTKTNLITNTETGITAKLLFVDSNGTLIGSENYQQIPSGTSLNGHFIHDSPTQTVAIVPIPDQTNWYLEITDQIHIPSKVIFSGILHNFLASIAMIILITIFIDLGFQRIVLSRLIVLRKILNQEWIDVSDFKGLEGDDQIGELVSAFQKMSRQIQRRVEMEQLVSDVSRELIGSNEHAYNEIVYNTLRKIGIFSQANYTYLSLFNDDFTTLNIDNEWCRSGFEQQAPTQKNFNPQNYPWLLEQLRKKEALIIDSRESLSAVAEEEINHWKEVFGNHSVIMSPIILNDSVIGFIGCNIQANSTTWSTFDTQLLRMVSEILGASIERNHAKKQIEEQDKQLLQAQKMETVGQLAGGIAHDFNNILAGIVSSTSLFREEHSGKDTFQRSTIEEFLNTVQTAGTRASQVVQQLLGLSRKQEYNFTTVKVNDILQQVIEIGKNSFDKSIKINLSLGKYMIRAQADAVQLEQVLLNLCVNSVHAMTIMRSSKESWGGELSLTSEVIHVDSEFRHQYPIAFENEYCKISITDTGIGIPEENLQKIYDPFFTTKTHGSGTGLGLSMIYRIVQEHFGFVSVESEVGKGTIFNIFLPAEDKEELEQEQEESTTIENKEFTGSAKILIVDDEPLLRKIASKILTSMGHTVVVAEDGGEAVDIFLEEHETIDAVVLDLVMPVLSGRETYIELKKIKPSIPVLISSGFRKDERIDEMIELGVADFLQKPYTVDEMKRVITKVLTRI